jgi:predicted membrane chloride channel (bestrophin family)
MKKQKPQSKQPKRIHERVFESDGVYFLKLVIVFILGTFWLKFNDPVMIGAFQLAAIPAGMFIGFLLVRAFEKHQADRKIWYALLVVIGVISNFQAAGIVI